VPKSEAQEKDVPVATRLVPDARATHYWDETGVTMRDYRATLGLPDDAWDVYLVYDRHARWDGELPPKPDYWMHQLGPPGDRRISRPYLDPAVFAVHVTSLLGRRAGAS
jgi:hypothetical protein